MSAEENKEFIREYFDALSGHKKTEELLDKYIADEALKQHGLQAEAAFPEYRLDPEEIIAEGDLVSVRATVSGAHLGPFQGLPPTGKEFHISMFITYRVVDNKIVEHWMLTDNMAMMQQLGVS